MQKVINIVILPRIMIGNWCPKVFPLPIIILCKSYLFMKKDVSLQPCWRL